MFRDVGRGARVEMERDDKSSETRNNSLTLAILFWALLSLSQLMVWFVALPLTVVWVAEDLSSHGLELKWTGGAKTFNWHPLLMVIGFAALAGDGTLVFRCMSRIGVSSKDVQKFLHGFLMTLAMVCMCVGLAAVFFFHNTQGFANLASLHSKLGLATAIQFGVQFVVGIVFYALPCMPAYWRRLLMPYHRFAGKSLLVLATMCILTGIQEKLGFESAKRSADLETAQAVGFVIVYAVAIICFALSRDEYRRYEQKQTGGEAKHHRSGGGGGNSSGGGSSGGGGTGGRKSNDPSEKALLPQE